MASPAPNTHTGVWRQLRATSGDATTTAPPPSVMTQQSIRCSGSEMTRELTTSSTVTGSRKRALRIHGGVVTHGHGHLGQLLGGGAVEVHVPASDHGVKADGGKAVKFLEAVRRRLQDGVAEATDAAGAH